MLERTCGCKGGKYCCWGRTKREAHSAATRRLQDEIDDILSSVVFPGLQSSFYKKRAASSKWQCARLVVLFFSQNALQTLMLEKLDVLTSLKLLWNSQSSFSRILLSSGKVFSFYSTLYCYHNWSLLHSRSEFFIGQELLKYFMRRHNRHDRQHWNAEVVLALIAEACYHQILKTSLSLFGRLPKRTITFSWRSLIVKMLWPENPLKWGIWLIIIVKFLTALAC